MAALAPLRTPLEFRVPNAHGLLDGSTQGAGMSGSSIALYTLNIVALVLLIVVLGISLAVWFTQSKKQQQIEEQQLDTEKQQLRQRQP